MEPPQRLEGQVIRSRTDEQVKAFRASSFEVYKQDHDMLTGARVLRLNKKRLQDEEDAYLRKMNDLVGGKPKRMLFPR